MLKKPGKFDEELDKSVVVIGGLPGCVLQQAGETVCDSFANDGGVKV